MELNTWQLIQLMLFVPFCVSAIWLARNRKQLKSKWNLFWHKARSVKVNMITRSGRNIELIVKPDDRGIMHIEGGAYPFLKETAVHNSKLGIPEVTLSESQPYPAIPDIVEVKVKTKVKVPKDGGGFAEKEGEIPGHLVSFHNVRTLKLAGKTSQELEGMLESKIVDDMVNATSKTMARLDLMFYIVCGIGAAVLIGFFIIHQDIKQLHAFLQGVQASNPGIAGR